MKNIFFFIIILSFFIYILNRIIFEKNLIPNYSGSDHQIFFKNKNVPLSGGIFLYLIFFLLSLKGSILFLIFISLLFFLGLLSDINILSSPKWRFIFQTTIIFFLIFFLKLNVETVRISLIDFYLENFLISCIFTTFCLMILINGTNFTDGLNGLVLSYYLSISYFIYKLNLNSFIFLNDQGYLIFIATVLVLLIFNLMNKLYLGDSGSYLIGLIYGIFLIQIFQSNNYISPYFIAVLLWYPAFETFFSILRKLKKNQSPTYADNHHLHQLLFKYINFRFKLKDNLSNNFSSFIIVSYNIFVFFISSQKIENSFYQVSIIIFNIVFYLLFYYCLRKYKN